MPLNIADGKMPAVQSAHTTAHATHGTADDMHEHAGMPDCAHCPPKSDDGQSTPPICLTDGTSNANAPKASAAPDFFKLFTESRLPAPSWTAAPPPPILAAVATDASPVEHTPLNVRHCVFLI